MHWSEKRSISAYAASANACAKLNQKKKYLRKIAFKKRAKKVYLIHSNIGIEIRGICLVKKCAQFKNFVVHFTRGMAVISRLMMMQARLVKWARGAADADRLPMEVRCTLMLNKHYFAVATSII